MTRPFLSLLLSRGGLSWFGGFLGGVGAGLWFLRRRRIPIMAALCSRRPGARGRACDRSNRLFSGRRRLRPADRSSVGRRVSTRIAPDDRSGASDAAVRNRRSCRIAWLLIGWRRARVADAIVFGRYLLLAGALRFLIEFVRVNAPVVGPFTLAQLFSAAIMIAGSMVHATTGSTR